MNNEKYAVTTRNPCNYMTGQQFMTEGGEVPVVPSRWGTATPTLLLYFTPHSMPNNMDKLKVNKPGFKTLSEL